MTCIFFIYIWSTVHSVAHYINFSKLPNGNSNYFTWGVGFTGHLLIAILVWIGVFSSKFVRRKMFHKFIASHLVLGSMYIIFMYLHQTFCFIRTDQKKCPLPTSWIWVTCPFVLYIFETIYKYTQTPIRNYTVVKHGSGNVFELQFPLPKSFAGKTIWLCCPSISYIEWHPFAVTYYNDTTVTCSVVIKESGNWTRKLAIALGLPKGMPIISPPHFLIYGPFYTSFVDTDLIQILNTNNTKCVIVTSGLGITTFANVITQVSKNHTIVIIAKHFRDISWIIQSLQDFTVYFFFTAMEQTYISDLGSTNFYYVFRRPDNTDLEHIFTNVQYVFHSGNMNVKSRLESECLKRGINFRHYE